MLSAKESHFRVLKSRNPWSSITIHSYILFSPSSGELTRDYCVPATEKKEASVVKIRSILWKKVRGVSWATEKKEASVVKIRSILWKKFRGVWRATEKNGASVVKVRSILWKKVRGLSQPIEKHTAYNRASVPFFLTRLYSVKAIFGWAKRESSTRRLNENWNVTLDLSILR